MIPIGINTEIFDTFSKLIKEELGKPESALSKANKNIIELRNKSTAIKQDLLDDIVSDFEKFILKTPLEQSNLVSSVYEKKMSLFFDYPRKNNRSKKRRVKSTRPFGKEILKALNYEKFREAYAHIILEKINIKTCPYCNAMLAVVLENENGKKNARCQLDHYYPKSKYPLLAISFFNLIPSCGQCNNIKSSKPSTLDKDFHLYREKNPLEGLTFEIVPYSAAQYLITNEIEKIKIKIKDVTKNKDTIKKHCNSFDLIGLYETQKDVVEELFWKAKAYNKSRIVELSNILGNIDPAIVKRLVIGNYIDAKDIHKRPLAKFTQDIAKQLKLL